MSESTVHRIKRNDAETPRREEEKRMKIQDQNIVFFASLRLGVLAFNAAYPEPSCFPAFSAFDTISAMHVLADETQVAGLIDGLASAVARDKSAVADNASWAVVGIRSRGDVLAKRLAQRVGIDRVGTLDITLYRDDLSEIGPQAIVGTTEIPFGIDGAHVVLVDDVLMTGRSIRAALQSLMDLGRPRRVWLSVLVDRGGRELPIHADHAGLVLTGANGQKIDSDDRVEVRLTPTDDRDAIFVSKPTEKGAVAR